MKYILSFILIISFTGEYFSQFRYTFETFPSNASVKMNNEEICKTPCEYDFYWREAKNNQLVFSVEKEGFYSWSDTLTEKPRDFDFSYNSKLKRVYPELEFDTLTPLVIFDKLIVTFKDGQELGSYKNRTDKIQTINWTGSTKIGSEKVEELFYEIANNAGINTPIHQVSKLFNDENKRLNPRFLVGVEIIDLDIKIENGLRYFDNNIKIEFNWKVKDRATDKIVLDYKNTGEIESRSRYFSISQENYAALEDAMVDFVSNDEFYELLKSTKPEKEIKTVLGELTIDSLASNEFSSFSEMIKYASQSCVTIETENGHGSGFFIDKSGMIMTSYHVIENANKLKIHLKNGMTFDAEVISKDKAFDVAIIKIPGSGYQALKLNSSPIELGQDVSTIGTPTDIELGQSLSKGVVSGLREIDGKVFNQLNLSVSPGNSGGPLLNENGEVTGIISSKLIGEGIEGIAFAVPTEKILEVLNIRY